MALCPGCTRVQESGSGGGEPERAAGDPAPIVLISIDTLRSDRLPAYGYGGVSTPAIDRVAREGIVFERAFSPYPLTLPAHASLLTGLLPARHGVRNNLGYRLDAGVPALLARRLQEAGYATGGAVSASVLRRETGIAAGFDSWDDQLGSARGAALGEQQRPGAATLERALGWLETVPGEQPFLLFLHLYEPHTPWDPPEPWRSRSEHPYDGEIAAADAVVGRLIEALEARGIWESAIVALVSDHGEGLGDHGEQEHGVLLYREALQVPLILKLPNGRRAGERVEETVRLVDVVPTLLEAAGLPIPEGLDGRSVFALSGEPAPRAAIAETWYPRLHLGWSELHSVIVGDDHYIDGPTPELFDLGDDPAERDDLLQERRARVHELREVLAEHRRPLEAPARVDPETAAGLAALGYLSAPRLVEGELPDPRGRIGALERFQDGLRALDSGAVARAVSIFRELLADEPGMRDARERLALALWRQGRLTEAEEHYRRVLEESGGLSTVALNLAALQQEQGRYEAARLHAELALASDPTGARLRLARIERAAGRPEVAEERAREALGAATGDGAEERLLLARILSETGRPDEALDILAGERAEDRAPSETGGSSHGATPDAELLAVRGDALARLGRQDDAVRDLERAVAIDAGLLEAWTRLAVLRVAGGDGPGGVATLREMVEVNPTPLAYAEAVRTLRGLGDPVGAEALLRHARGLFPDAGPLFDRVG